MKCDPHAMRARAFLSIFVGWYFAAVAAAQLNGADVPAADDAGRGAFGTVSRSLGVDKWAIIVGISKYKHEELNLKFADRDADELCRLLQSPSGGAFAADHIHRLTNEDATTAKITWALRSFLKRPAPDDIVVIYFSCHGVKDPDRDGIVYLLTHDTDPADISGTALPMREINHCINDYLLSKRVVIVADTCHSAAIGGEGKKNLRKINST